MPTVNECCKILRSLNRVYVFEIVLLLVPRLKILRRRGLSYFGIFEKQEAQSSSQETNHNKVTNILHTWPGRPFLGKLSNNVVNLASDSTLLAWGGLNVSTNEVVHDFWGPNASHINHKELQASIHTAMALAPPHSQVNIDIDNSLAFSYLMHHGGKIGKLNEILRPFLHWMNLHSVSLVPLLVPSSQMQADAIFRWSVDPGDYSLDPQVFHHLLHVFRNHVHPTVDLFASPSNALLPAVGSRWPHHRAVVVDAEGYLGGGGDLEASLRHAHLKPQNP